MSDLGNLSEDELREYLNGWLDAMMEVYGSILEDWENHNVVQQRTGAHVKYHCNNCGKCCNFENHWVWIYPSDMVRWLKDLDKDKIIPLLLGIIFPVEDNEGYYGYGLPSQKSISEKLPIFIKNAQESPLIQDTFRMILGQLKIINPGFKKDSDYCIFYNPGVEEHCMIHDKRPIQCKAYPFDFPQFTEIVIPEELSDRYGASSDDLSDLPLCPLETYEGGKPEEGIMVSEDQMEWVTLEKSNYLTSTVTEEWQEADISEILLEIFHKDILNMDRNTIFVEQPPQKDSSKSQEAPSAVKFVEGKRLSKKTTKAKQSKEAAPKKTTAKKESKKKKSSKKL